MGAIWFASYLVFQGTAYGTKRTNSSHIDAFNTIFKLSIPYPFHKDTRYPMKVSRYHQGVDDKGDPLGGFDLSRC